ncbi:histidine-containing phosphotransfer protein 1 [Brachypodium distachyon]|uniref:Histidine-containing phosphotransfer protein n=1 Tax=Brachypodium distachyon TaxID=15368 RepID=A0A0Q3GBQ0_BRADI|nr:histidine-containing phosphotransfer protein 1 [Brachypodium distachyon]KQK07957.1 hypothetical protein BRADI_2g38601v3 [Brachypodium distachyon]|eukprot:XP_003566682.1 histidine-containing phosphotransfer protein 1 [Brachypodium distachyon]
MDATQQLNALMENMFSTGLLDNEFNNLKLLQDSNNPNAVSEVIMIFCDDGEQTIAELAKLLNQPSVDYERVSTFAHKIMGASASVGAKRVRNTCTLLCDFCKDKNNHGCLNTLDSVWIEFDNLRNKFHTMIQIDHLIC